MIYIILFILITACTLKKNNDKNLFKRWHLHSLENPFSISFSIRSDGSVEGLNKCNFFDGNYTYKDNNINFNSLKETKKACINSSNYNLTGILQNTKTYSIDLDKIGIQTLYLYDEKGNQNNFYQQFKLELQKESINIYNKPIREPLFHYFAIINNQKIYFDSKELVEGKCFMYGIEKKTDKYYTYKSFKQSIHLYFSPNQEIFYNTDYNVSIKFLESNIINIIDKDVKISGTYNYIKEKRHSIQINIDNNEKYDSKLANLLHNKTFIYSFRTGSCPEKNLELKNVLSPNNILKFDNRLCY
tara:strand:- start:538 stop:1440 length:903 start_codon:yes stop_codon:yes gene_type:complete